MKLTVIQRGRIVYTLRNGSEQTETKKTTRERLFSRFEVKLLYWLGKAGLTIFMGIIGIFALIFLYILITALLHV